MSKLRSIFLSFFFTLVCMPVVLAQQNFWMWIYERAFPEYTFGWILSYLIIFAILTMTFKDVFTFTGIFSSPTQWVIGVGLALIVAFTGGLNVIVTWVFSAVALWGAFVVTAVIAGAFLIFLLAHIFLWKALIWAKTEEEIRKAEKKAGTWAAAGRALEKLFKKGIE